MLLTPLLLIPLMGAGLLALSRRRTVTETLHLVMTIFTLGVGLVAAMQVWQASSTTASLTALAGLLRADALSALMIVVITLLAAIVALYARGYIRAEYSDLHLARVRRFFTLYV